MNYVAEHTSNEWRIEGLDTMVISNAVYKLVCRYGVLPGKYSKHGREVFLVEWQLTTNAVVHLLPLFPSPTYENYYIDAKRRRFPTQKKAQECLKEVAAGCAGYFREIYPPIPEEYLPCFMVDGALPPPFRGEEATVVNPSVTAVGGASSPQ